MNASDYYLDYVKDRRVDWQGYQSRPWKVMLADMAERDRMFAEDPKYVEARRIKAEKDAQRKAQRAVAKYIVLTKVPQDLLQHVLEVFPEISLTEDERETAREVMKRLENDNSISN